METLSVMMQAEVQLERLLSDYRAGCSDDPWRVAYTSSSELGVFYTRGVLTRIVRWKDTWCMSRCCAVAD
jgi:hypothetical protein